MRLHHVRGRGALRAAAEGGQLAALGRLLEEEAEINAPACEGSRTPGCAWGWISAYRSALLKGGADVDARGANPTGGTAAEVV